jgi:hypothetical protein
MKLFKNLGNGWGSITHVKANLILAALCCFAIAAAIGAGLYLRNASN